MQQNDAVFFGNNAIFITNFYKAIIDYKESYFKNQ